MSRRSFQVLAAVAAGLLLLLLLVERGGREADEAIGRVLLPDLEAELENLESVTIEAAGEEAVIIRRNGDAWVVVSRNDFPADVANLRRTVRALAAARVVEEKTAIAANYGRIGVDDPREGGSGTLVRLTAGTYEEDVIVGNPAQGDYRYVRIAGAAPSYLVDRDPGLAEAEGGWLATDVLDISMERIERVRIEHADGETIGIARAGENDDFKLLDIPEGRELSYPAVADSIARALEQLTLTDVEAGTDAPVTITTTFETRDGLTITARVASMDDRDLVAFGATADGAQAPVDEAVAINDRVEGWWYELPGHKAGLFTRRWADLLGDEQAGD